MCSHINNELFKKILILFWTLWWLVTLWTDIAGALSQLGIVHATWAPNSNYPFLVNALKMYPVGAWLPEVLFCGILTWSVFSAGSFCWASLALAKDKQVWLRRAELAFIISLTYWLAFFLADTIVMKFDVLANHMAQGGFELLSFFAFYILPSSNVVIPRSASDEGSPSDI